MGAIYLLLECGNEFHDSDTLGMEHSDMRLRIRFMPEGQHAQVDTWVLIHPKSSLDETEHFGDRTRPPAPKGIDNRIYADEGFFGRLMRKAVGR